MDRNRAPYPSDLTDAQWQRIAPVIPAARRGGRPRSVNIREIVNAIFYLSRTGCAWRLLPHDFPPWGTVHYYFRRWRLDSTWQNIHDGLRVAVRRAAERDASPSAAIIDSQSVKTTEKGDLAAMMLPRRSPDANGIWRWIRWAACSSWWCMQRTSRIAMEQSLS